MRGVTLTQLYNDYRHANATRRGRELSHRAAAERAGAPGMYETFRKIGNGTHRGNLDEETVRALVRLGLVEADVRRAAGLQAVTDTSPFRLPKNADRLTTRQREAVRAVVLAMLDPHGAGGEVGGDAAVLNDEGRKILTAVKNAPTAARRRKS